MKSICTYLSMFGISVIEYNRLGNLKRKVLYTSIEPHIEPH